MDRKIKVLSLITVVLVAAVGTAMVFALDSPQPKADATGSISQSIQPSYSAVNDTNGNGFMNWNIGFGGPREAGGRFGGFGGFRGFAPNFNGTFGGFGSIQVSSAFTENVTTILNSSTDVQALLNQGWNVTAIRPVITTSIDGNGNVITKATSADVILQGTNGRALVVVDLTTDKVTKIVTTTVNNNPT